jgi:hypothetical protein
MTTLYKAPCERQEDIDWLIECFGTLVSLQLGFPCGALESEVPPEVQVLMEKVQQDVRALLVSAPAALWEYAKARGLAEEVAKAIEENQLPNTNGWSVDDTWVGKPIWEWRKQTQ